MREQVVLDLLGGHLLAAAVDLVLCAALDNQVSRIGDADQIAGAIETFGVEDLGIVRIRPVIAADRVRPPSQ